MKILVTNDDGIFAEGLWALVRELKDIAQVVVVAPDKEQSAIGTAITWRQPIRVRKVKPLIPEVEAYSVKGTPADSVILGLGKLVKNEVDLVISGINQGPNLGQDVFVSGTVGAALQGYIRGYSALAISVFRKPNEQYLSKAAKVARLLTQKIASHILPRNILLNVNIPELALTEIKGIKSTRLASESHFEPVEEEYGRKWQSYCIVPQEIDNNDETTDAWSVNQGNISITPLHTYLNSEASPSITDSFCSDLFQTLRKSRGN